MTDSTAEYFVPPAPEPPTAAAPLTPDRKSEARRAYREVRTAIALMQQRWPAAFPEAPQQVRPLITGLTSPIATALGWSHPYTRAVLRTWKLRPAYCHAVLAHPVRFDLDGNPTDQPIDEDTRIQAKARLVAVADKRRRLETRLNERAAPPAAAPGPQQQEATAKREPPPPSLPPSLLAERGSAQQPQPPQQRQQSPAPQAQLVQQPSRPPAPKPPSAPPAPKLRPAQQQKQLPAAKSTRLQADRVFAQRPLPAQPQGPPPAPQQRQSAPPASKPKQPAQPAPVWRSGDRVRWNGYVGTFLREMVGGDVEVLIGPRTYKVPKAELRPA
jgi:sRNA-binding protein